MKDQYIPQLLPETSTLHFLLQLLTFSSTPVCFKDCFKCTYHPSQTQEFQHFCSTRCFESGDTQNPCLGRDILMQSSAFTTHGIVRDATVDCKDECNVSGSLSCGVPLNSHTTCHHRNWRDMN